MDTQVNKRISDQLKDTDADDILYTHHLNKKIDINTYFLGLALRFSFHYYSMATVRS